jgi:enoyl-CoA hydratase/carnithine racemase
MGRTGLDKRPGAVYPGGRVNRGGDMSDTVLAARDGRIGRLQMNRPAALNALTQEMIAALFAALTAWRTDPHIHAVVIEGLGGRAFCAGGDIRAVRDAALAGDAASIHTFFSEEYKLNRLIAEFGKPYIALIDGICMGGGIGVSVHGAYRVVTEAALLAMPETGIALFPDVGASFVLPRLPGALGYYLGLTGTRISGADAVHAGFATHFVPRAGLPDLSAALARDGVAALAEFTTALPPFSLAPHRAAIDRCFSAASVEEIFKRLETEGEWGQATSATLRAASPSSLLWSFGILRRGANRSLAECLDAELSLTRGVCAHPDFAEGVRAMIIDKDRAPKWSPPALEEVDQSAIEEMLK